MDPIRENSKKTGLFLGGTIKNSSFNLVVPLSIFQDRRLTPLEAVIKYLKEKRGLSYHKISKLLSRNVRDVYKTYAHAFDKSSYKLDVKFEHSHVIPLSILSNRRLSALESIVLYLKDNLKISYCEISVLLNRDQRTIWTVYQRARKKDGR